MSNIFTHGHACIIGAGADLPNTVEDAVGLANILTDPGRCAYPPNQVHLLTSKTATRASIFSALDTLARSTDAHSTVVIYFSGHGYQVTGATGNSYYLMPYGYNLYQLNETAISGSELIAHLQALPAKKVLVLLDCCHAGGIGDTKNSALQLIKSSLPPEAQQMLAKGNGRAIIASSQANEVSLAGKPYSAFTAALLEALCGQGASQQDGYVRVTDLALYTREVVTRRTHDKQHPILDFFEPTDNFVLAYYAGGDTQIKELPFVEPEIELEPVELNRQLIDGDYVGRDRIDGNKVNGDKISVGNIYRSTGIAIGRSASVSFNTINQLQGSYNPEAQKLADLLKQLQFAIEGVDSGLSQKNQEKALKHLHVISKFGRDCQNLDLREQAETALDALPTILTQGTGLNKTCTDSLLENIREILGI